MHATSCSLQSQCLGQLLLGGMANVRATTPAAPAVGAATAHSCLSTSPGLPSPPLQYPGGKYFDFLGLSYDPKIFADYQQKEIRNGRLAMVAFLGFAAQVGAGRIGQAACMPDIWSQDTCSRGSASAGMHVRWRFGALAFVLLSSSLATH